jgi:hypothetical protein
MADNVNITPGAGKVIAADDIAGVMYQRVKPSWGADGVATDVSVADPLPVGGTLLSSLDTKIPASQLGYSPVFLPLESGDRGNIIPADFDGWTAGTDTVIGTDATGAQPIPGITSWYTLTYTAANGQGAYIVRDVSGRTDGARLLYSVYVRNRTGSTKSLLVQLRADDGAVQDFIYPPSYAVPGDSVWRRVSFALVINIASANNTIMRIYGAPGESYALDVACPHLQQTEQLTPSDYQPPLANQNTPILLNVPRVSFTCWGDSLVGGAYGYEFRTELSRLLNGSNDYNGGIGGETSTQIRDRMAPVDWVASTAYALGVYRSNGANIYKVTTAGTSAGSGGPTGTGTGIADGSVVWDYYGTIAAPEAYNRYGIVVIEAGRNNMASVDLVLSDIADMVATVPHGRFLIMEVWNGMSEPQGGAVYGYMQQINEALYLRYGSRLVRWRQQFTAGSSDDTPHANLMEDNVHPNRAGHGIIAWSIFSSMNSNGYLPLAFGSQRSPRLGTACPSASQPVSLPDDVMVLSTDDQTVINTDLLSEGVSCWYDARGFRSIALDLIQSAGIASGVVSFEHTNDVLNAPNGSPLYLQNLSAPNSAPVSSLTLADSTVTKFGGAILSGWIRVRISTAVGGGSVRIAASLSQLSYASQWVHVSPQLGEGEWRYVAASGGIDNTTTAVTVKAAAATGIRNYVKSIDLSWDALTNATEVAIRDGAGGTVLWRFRIPATTPGNFSHIFASPRRGSAATLLEVVTLAASGAGKVYANLDGYEAR